MKKATRNLHTGSSFDAYLEEEGILEEVREHAIKAILAFQLGQAMKERNLSKKKMAEELHTSRTQITRMLDPTNDAVTLATLSKAAKLVGKKIRLDLVDARPVNARSA
jgi:antitoxin HicB